MSECPVIVGDIESLLARNQAGFGLIYSSHSFEHVPDPLRALEVLHTCLRPGGRLVLIFPNCESLVCRLFGSDAVSWDPPRHLTLPTVRVMTEILGRIGYVEVRVRTVSRRAAHYASVSKAYRRGLIGTQSWYETIGSKERLLAATERVLTAVGVSVGEEMVVSARKSDGKA